MVIVNAASSQETNGLRKSTAYSSSKRGEVGLMSRMAQEIAKDKLRVNAVTPGGIDAAAGSGGRHDFKA